MAAREGHGHISNRVTLVGSSLSQTQKLLSAMIDEPLREIDAAGANEATVLAAFRQLDASNPFTIKYAPGSPQLLNGNAVTLDRHWLQQANLQITVLIDPTVTEAAHDLIYDSEAVFFVTDDYALSSSGASTSQSRPSWRCHSRAALALCCQAKRSSRRQLDSRIGS